MTEYVIKLATFGRHAEQKSTPGVGNVKLDQVAVFENLRGHVIRCTSGHLWVTREGDVMDRVIRPDHPYTVPSEGKVIIGGKGGYVIEPGSRMDMAS